MTTVAFVPVRGGSRGIPGENARPFCGRPLVVWCLRALQAARAVDRVVVATDCDRIEEIVRRAGLGKVEIYRCSADTATDGASTESVMLEYLDQEPLTDDDTFVLVQATSPFTRARDFDDALELHAGGVADSILSCVRVKRFFWADDGHPENYDLAARPRRQDFDGTLMENGAFYVNRVGHVRAARNRLSGSVAPFVMPSHTGLELDDEDDWIAGEALMRRHAEPGDVVASGIRLVLTDVDGVLTDGGVYHGEGGDELKKFNTLDGKAFELLRERGIATGIVTAEETRIVADRAAKIRADHVFQGVHDKLAVVEALCLQLGMSLGEVAYVGDDLGDLELLAAVGFAACPRTAMTSVKDVAHYICEAGGGEGCLREVVERLLASRSATPGADGSGAGGVAAVDATDVDEPTPRTPATVH